MLRDFQTILQGGCFQAWHDGAINVMATMATGGGKTVVVADTIQKFDVPTCVIAHRQELVGQMALALNRERVAHAIIAPKKVIQQIIAWEMETHGHSCYDPRAMVRVAAVDTLIRRDPNDRWFNQVLLAVVDEGHHVLRGNKWGRSLLMLPNARGLFVTAHAVRADGCGLGRDAKMADGLVDRLVIGPCGRELISRGFLCDYRLVCPPSRLNLESVSVGASGEFNQHQLAVAVHQDGTIVGDVVANYLRYGAGKLWITFAVDIESATDLVKAYRAKDVPAEVITGETPIPIRAQLMKKFRNRQILQLISVDVLGEGVDVPAIEGVSMARPTASFQLYAQQFGRALRLFLPDDVSQRWGSYTDEYRLDYIAKSPKPKAIILDHVGNCHRFYEDHKFVDSPQRYTLNRREKTTRQKKGDAIPLRTCLFCLQPYEVVEPECPHCGEAYVPQGRTKPAEVDGDINEIAPEVLAQMRGAIAKIDRQPYFPKDALPVVINSIKKAHRERQETQATLRQAIALWAGWQLNHLLRPESEAYRRFFYKFGIDVLSAQALGSTDAAELEARIRAELNQHNIVEALPNENRIAISG